MARASAVAGANLGVIIVRFPRMVLISLALFTAWGSVAGGRKLVLLLSSGRRLSKSPLPNGLWWDPD